MTESVIEFYTTTVRQEWRRLVQDAYHTLELSTTLRYLDRYLPAQGHVLDAGCGPGRYARELAGRGYDLTLFDLTPVNLEFAQRQLKRARLQQRVKQFVEGSIVDLTCFADCTFDAVVCLGGPLSHLLDASDRECAVAELIRVAKPGAPIFVSVMGRFSLLALELMLFQNEIEMPFFELLRDTGDYTGFLNFTACHFFLPEDFHTLFADAPVSIEAMVGLEGVGARENKLINRLARNKVRWGIWLETHHRTCTHPAVVGMSEHMLIVCRKL